MWAPESCDQYILGKKWSEKVKEVRVAMEKAGAIAVIVTALDEVACEFIVVKSIHFINHC